MYSPNIDRVISSDQIRAFRFPIFSEFLLIFQGFADDSLCPVPGSRSWSLPLGPARAAPLVRAGRRPVGPEVQEELDFCKGFRALDLESNAIGLLLLLPDNYNHETNDFTTELTERTEDAQRLFDRDPASPA